MNIKYIIDKLTKNLVELFGKEVKIIGLQRNQAGWIAHAEVIEEDEYMTMYARDQLIGTYEVKLDAAGEILGYKRIQMRERGDVAELELNNPAEE